MGRRGWSNLDERHVAASFRSIAERQGGEKRTDTEAILAILEDKRVEVLDREEAGYFIRDRQEHRSGAADDIPGRPLPGDQEHRPAG